MRGLKNVSVPEILEPASMAKLTKFEALLARSQAAELGRHDVVVGHKSTQMRYKKRNGVQVSHVNMRHKTGNSPTSTIYFYKLLLSHNFFLPHHATIFESIN